MKTQCKHCKHVYSITASPNDYEGYFLSDVVLDKHDGEELAFYRMREIGAVRITRCPNCKEFTVQ